MSERRYAIRPGDESDIGTPENRTRCVEPVYVTANFSGIQCYRKRGHGKDGLYCRQHARKHPAEDGKP